MLCVCYLSAWSCGTKGVNLHLGKSYFCHFCYWDVYSIAFFHPYSLSCLFLKRKKKKPKQKYTVLHALILQPVTFSSFPFSLTGQFRKGSPVRVFRWWWGSLSTDFFSSCEPFTPRNQTVAFSFVNILWGAARLESTTLWILSLQLLYAIHSELFCSSFEQVFNFFFLTWGHMKTKKVDVTSANAAVFSQLK